jgi:hypothetical protein
MSLTESRPTDRPAPTRNDTRVAAGAAALLALALFMTVASVNVPHDASDQDLLRWWQDAGNRTSGVLSGFWALVVACSVAVVANHLVRLSGADRSPAWLAFARSMGAAVTAVWLVTGAARAAIGHLVDVMGETLPGVDVLRTVTAFNYTLLGQSGMAVLALFMLATSVVVLRTGVAGRWVGYVGAGCGVLMLGAVAAQYGAYTTPLAILWALCLAVALLRRR